MAQYYVAVVANSCAIWSISNKWADGREDLEVFIKKEGGRAKRAGGETRWQIGSVSPYYISRCRRRGAWRRKGRVGVA